ncbi:MAG: diaminopimelate decarboxylase [Phycisphaeraceae bacterium]
MDFFRYHDGRLHCEDVPLDAIADAAGTPAFVYSQRTFEHHYDALVGAFAELEPTICFSIKSCGNVHILRHLVARGAGMDVVSGGELFRAQHAGADMARVVYAGVGKTDQEIRDALEARIGWFNIESEAEFENIARLAGEMGAHAQAALRVNPDVDPQTHAKTSTGQKETKFGVDIERARQFFETYGKNPHLTLNALHLHIGSPIYQTEPYEHAIGKAITLIQQLTARGHAIEALDIGGGFGADYEANQSPSYDDYAQRIVPLLQPFKRNGGRVILEPGRTIAANAGVLVTEVLYIKQGGSRTFVIVDTGMHHLLRPALYDAFHFIWPTHVDPALVPEQRTATPDLPGLVTCDVVGPICETGDTLARERAQRPVERGQRLAIFAAGAYGMAMASNYNAMPRPAEILVDGDEAQVIRRRETYADLIARDLPLG